MRSDYADAQAGLSLRWSHKSYRRFSRALAYIFLKSMHDCRIIISQEVATLLIVLSVSICA